MGQEFVIKSTTLEDKVNQLLPSQGGAQAGVDLSASTTIVPIIDLTESAEGSTLRQDLQSALSFDSVTAFNVSNSNTTIINTTGTFRIFGSGNIFGAGFIQFNVNDGATTKMLNQFVGIAGQTSVISFDFLLLLKAGESLEINSTTSNNRCNGVTRQIADLSGNLINP